jgi:hypothetical protein
MRNPLRIEVSRGIYGNLNDGFSIATFDYRMVMVDAGGARTLTAQNWLQTRSQIGYTDIHARSWQYLIRKWIENEENMARYGK